MLSEEKYYNKISENTIMSVEDAKNIINDMRNDKFKIIGKVKYTNLETATIRMLKEAQSLERKLEKLQKEITRLQNKLLDKIEGTKIIKEETTEYIKENYISKDKIRKLIKEKQDKINKLHSASDCVIIDDLENQISILQELLESSDINE